MQSFITSERVAGVERLSTPANKVGSGLEVDPFFIFGRLMKSTPLVRVFQVLGSEKWGLPSRLGFPSGNNTLSTPSDPKNLDSGPFHSRVYPF